VGTHQALRRPLRAGRAAANYPKLLQRIFQLIQAPGQLLLQAQQPPEEDTWRYITKALAARRLRPLLDHGTRVLVPLPGARVWTPGPGRGGASGRSKRANGCTARLALRVAQREGRKP
jgi:hypothetical protein